MLSLVVVLGGILFKFLPAMKGFAPIAKAIEHFPQINALNSFIPLISGGGASGGALALLGLDHLWHQRDGFNSQTNAKNYFPNLCSTTTNSEEENIDEDNPDSSEGETS